MIVWVLCNPLLFNLFGRSELKFNRVYCGLFTTFGILTILFYFRGYVNPSDHPEISGSFRPFRFIHFFTILIWAPFSMAWVSIYYHLSCYQCFFMSFIIISILFEVIKLKIKLSSFNYAMFIILGYGLISCCAISFGRVGFGLKYAMADNTQVSPFGFILRYWDLFTP